MNTGIDRIIAPGWDRFRRIWLVVTVVLLGLVLLLAVAGFGPGGRNCPLAECAPATELISAPASAPSIAPNLVLRGPDPLYVAVGDPFVEPGVRATDALGAPLPVTASGRVDSQLPGVYVMTYSATDEAGRTTHISRQVIVEGGRSRAAIERP